MIPYPKGLPYPLRDNYGFEQTNNIQRTDMASGRARQRVAFRNAPSRVSLQWLMSAGQAAVFESWAALIVGAGWCQIPVRTPLGLEDTEVRFTSVPTGPALFGVNHWKFSAVCELRKRPLLPPDWIEVFPEIVIGSDIFDLAINREWPKP